MIHLAGACSGTRVTTATATTQYRVASYSGCYYGPGITESVSGALVLSDTGAHLLVLSASVSRTVSGRNRRRSITVSRFLAVGDVMSFVQPTLGNSYSHESGTLIPIGGEEL